MAQLSPSLFKVIVGNYTIPTIVDDVDKKEGNTKKEDNPGEKIWEEECKPAYDDEETWWQVESDDEWAGGPGEEDLHPVHAVVLWNILTNDVT